MMNEKFDLSIIIPAYLEAENLGVILPQLNNVLQNMDISYEILVIDTMLAMDNTHEMCLVNNVVYVNRKNGNNYGDAIRTGIESSRGDKIIFMDADGSHDPEFIRELFKYKNDYGIVIASRYIDGGGIENSKLLIFMSRVLNLTYSIVLNIKCKDLSNSYKLYDSTSLKNIILYCNNFDIVEEIIYKIVKSNKQIRIIEIPYVFKKRMYGETKRNLIIFMFSYFLTMLRLRFGK